VPFASANNNRIVLDATFVDGTYSTRALRAANTWPFCGGVRAMTHLTLDPDIGPNPTDTMLTGHGCRYLRRHPPTTKGTPCHFFVV